MLPGGVKIVPIYDRTWLIDKTLNTVFTNLLEGALLVTLVLLAVPRQSARGRDRRRSPSRSSLLATFLGLTWIGIPANLLSLGAMDFGIIVDGAVIVVENVFRKLHRGERATTASTTERCKHTILRRRGGGRAGRRCSRC